MSTPTPGTEAVRAELRALSTPQERADYLKQLAYLFYDHTKFRALGGEGGDGRDGPERRSVGLVINAVEEHWMAARHHWHRDPGPA